MTTLQQCLDELGQQRNKVENVERQRKTKQTKE